MKKYKIRDSLGKEKIVQAESVVDAIKKTKTHIKDSVVIGTNEDGTEFTYKNGAFYADGIKLEHELVKDALQVNDARYPEAAKEIKATLKDYYAYMRNANECLRDDVQNCYSYLEAASIAIRSALPKISNILNKYLYLYGSKGGK